MFRGRSIRLATEPLLKSVEVLKPLGVRLSHLPFFKVFLNLCLDIHTKVCCQKD